MDEQSTAPAKCEHYYEETSSSSNFDYERYVCKKCGDTYKLYYDEMR